MGRKGKWFGAVERVFNHETKGEIGQKRSRSMKDMTIGCCYIEPDLHEDLAPHSAVFPLPQEEVSLAYPENDHNKEAVNEAYSQNDHNEGDVKMACVENDHTEEDNKLVFLRNIDDNKSEVVRYKKFPGEFKEDAAATAIQAEFRGYVVRKAMRAVRGTMRLKSMIHSDAVKNQSASALLCMQMLVRAQAQIRSRRIKMAEENKAIESQQELKFERELEKLKLQQQGDKWDDSIRTTEQHNSHLKFKQEAAIRRERSLSYAHRVQMQQLKRSSPSAANMTFMEPTTQWGWSSTECWESNHVLTGKSATHDYAPLKSASYRVTGTGETGKASANEEVKTPSGKAKTRFYSLSMNMMDASLAGSMKKRLAFPMGGLPSPNTPSPRRHSGPQQF